MAKSPPLTRLVADGIWGAVVCFVRENGNCPALDFLEDDLRPTDAAAHARCLALFQEMAERGQVGRRSLKREEFGFAFSVEYKKMQLRFPCLRDGDRWVLLFGFQKHGAQKARGKWRSEDNEKAKQLTKEYWHRKSGQV
jgi:hypothetical protein